jgi:hypothetical protein
MGHMVGERKQISPISKVLLAKIVGFLGSTGAAVDQLGVFMSHDL